MDDFDLEVQGWQVELRITYWAKFNKYASYTP